jgi:hypothetical protein
MQESEVKFFLPLKEGVKAILSFFLVYLYQTITKPLKIDFRAISA